MDVRAFVGKYSLLLCLFLAGVEAALLSAHQIAIPILPMADGKGYALRAFALYGDLHTGQWANAWALLTTPFQSILALQDPLFFLLPTSLAGFASYVILQNAITFLLLACAVYKIARALQRPEWAPAVFLLTSVNNITWTDFYACFLDTQFCALGLLAIAGQMEARAQLRPRSGVLSGVSLGLLFLLKPANAVIFLALYALSELFFLVCDFRIDAATGRLHMQPPLTQRWTWQTLGFLPVFLIALLLGAPQAILQLINQNEVTMPATVALINTGLLRLFYFPLCLASCYHVLLLGGLLVALWLLAEFFPALKSRPTSSPLVTLIVPIGLAYFILGEFFSFVMLDKPVRALLLVLPIGWFLVGAIWEKQHLRWDWFLALAVLYATLVYGQKESAWFGHRGTIADSYYPLTTASWTELPAAWHHPGTLSTAICDQVLRDAPPGAVICVNATEIRHDLAWRLENGPFLHGDTTPHHVRDLFDFEGKYYPHALIGANMVVLITFYPVQTSRALYLHSSSALAEFQQKWLGPNPVAEARALPSMQGEPVGYELILNHPLTQAEVDDLNQSPTFATCPLATLPGIDFPVNGRHYTWAEGEQLLLAWYKRRFQ